LTAIHNENNAMNGHLKHRLYPRPTKQVTTHHKKTEPRGLAHADVTVMSFMASRCVCLKEFSHLSEKEQSFFILIPLSVSTEPTRY
jgi:hypothetical protein